ncbi:unnamed protein product [Adineta ricciae]|uniref:DED domain-containing protein n=1 Tax=Adineta ricciae TaxID=249248 RepID=A0A815MK68_ADIRI|nr:unnamed protein product [Adineta ricciae]
MDNTRLRSTILSAIDRLNDNDLVCLHSCLGDDVPRRLRDDRTRSGTLKLIDSLFDRNKINNEYLTYLIQVFDQIQCYDAAKPLKEYMKQNRAMVTSQLVRSPPLGAAVFADAFEDEDRISEDLILHSSNELYKSDWKKPLYTSFHSGAFEPV